MLRRAVLLAVCLGAVAHGSSQVDWHLGAPCSVQHTLRPNQAGGITKVEPPYHLSVTNSNGNRVHFYRPDSVYTVRLTGTVHFRALLAQARLATKDGFIIGHLRAGQFLPEANWVDYGIRIQDCPPVFNNSITNIDWEKKFVIEAKWRSQYNSGPVQFYFTIMQESGVYWEQWKPDAGFLLPAEDAKFSEGAIKVDQPPPPDTRVVHPADSKSPPSDQVEGSGEDEPPVVVVVDAVDVFTTTIGPDGAPTISRQDSTTTEPVAVTVHESNEIDSYELGSHEFDSDELLTNAPLLILTDGTTTQPPLPPPIETVTQPPQPAIVVETQPFVVEETQPPILILTEPTPPPRPQPPQPSHEVAGPEGSVPGEENAEEVWVIDGRTGRLITFKEAKEREELELSEEAVVVPAVHVKPVDGDYCFKNPCQHGGTCINLPEEDTFICECPTDFTGVTCENTNHCLRSRCEHGALCRNEEHGYSCTCRGEWAGDLCDRHCPAYLCENGGSCAIDPRTNDYTCLCTPGWTGQRCDHDLDECFSNPCLNGAKCEDHFNGYTCTCAPGFMGDTCYRPCQDIYYSCTRWRQEDRCEMMRGRTEFFDVNCAPTCNQCTFVNATVRTIKPMPPILEPFTFLIGRWVANSSAHYRFPVDFTDDTSSYSEAWEFSISEVPMFGTPSVNFSAVAVSRDDPNDRQITFGFLTLNGRHLEGRPYDVALMTTGNDGMTFIEEGFLYPDENRLKLSIKYSAVHTLVSGNKPNQETTTRTITLSGPYLKETVSKTNADGSRALFNKYYYRALRYLSF